MHGVTKPVNFTFRRGTDGQGSVGRHVRTGGERDAFKVKRTDYGVSFMSKPGEISDEVELTDRTSKRSSRNNVAHRRRGLTQRGFSRGPRSGSGLVVRPGPCAKSQRRAAIQATLAAALGFVLGAYLLLFHLGSAAGGRERVVLLRGVGARRDSPWCRASSTVGPRYVGARAHHRRDVCGVGPLPHRAEPPDRGRGLAQPRGVLLVLVSRGPGR